MKKKLLIIEDETSLAKQLKWALDKEYAVTIASAPRQAKSLVATGEYPVITLDLGLPPVPSSPEEGFKLLEEIRSVAPHSKVIVITGNSEEENAVRAIRLGAVDFCAKPIDVRILEIILSRSFHLYSIEEANRRLIHHCGTAGMLCGMLGISQPMEDVFHTIQQVGATDYTVLVTGESGTGKEMAAQAIHTLSRRAAKPLVVINCGAIPENLLESELFGHEKGAYTGAVSRKFGRLELADGGTAFLDEIGDMPLSLQVKILRFLQEGTIERVGGNQTIKLDARIIAATNMDLQQAVEAGSFRADLFHRLNVLTVKLPPLRERREDIVLLAHQFLREEFRVMEREALPISQRAMDAMRAYSWPGNVRELRNAIRRAAALAQGAIEPHHLGLEVQNGEDIVPPRMRRMTLQEARERAEILAVREALAATGNNVTRAAILLDVSRPTLHDLIKRHRINER